MAEVKWERSKSGRTYRVVRGPIGKIGSIELETLPRGNYHDLGGDVPSWVDMKSYVLVHRVGGGKVPYATETKVFQLAAESLQDAIIFAASPSLFAASPSPSAPKKAPKKKTSSKPKLRKNRFSVRCHSYKGGYLTFEGSLTKTEATRIYRECKANGYTPAIFDGRKKVK